MGQKEMLNKNLSIFVSMFIVDQAALSYHEPVSGRPKAVS